MRDARDFDGYETNDCAVRAVAACTAEPYFYVRDLFRKAGRKPGGRTYLDITFKVLRKLGFVPEPWQYTSKTIVTLERELPASGVFLIRVRRHILARVDGLTVDWAAGRRHRITNVWAVTRGS